MLETSVDLYLEAERVQMDKERKPVSPNAAAHQLVDSVRLQSYMGSDEDDRTSLEYFIGASTPTRRRMNMNKERSLLPLMALFGLGLLALAQNASEKMSFFITSAGPGNGAALGGLAGADRHCQALATAVGAGNRTWRAYLSASASGGQAAINARDRIGKGPWYNAKGVLVAKNVDDLHSANNNLKKETSISEKGEVLNGRGDNPNQHDILTGSQADGSAFTGGADKTCNNWTSSGEGSAQVGHHDRQGGGDDPTSWNSAHGSKGCSQANLVSTGGAGRFYCFAVN